jgi:hypothetical protein
MRPKGERPYILRHALLAARAPSSRQIALTTVMLLSRNPSFIPLKFVEERLRARREYLLGQRVYLNKGITNQAIRFLNIPSVIHWVKLFHQLQWLTKHRNSRTHGPITRA